MKNERELFNKWVLTHPNNLDLTKHEEGIMFDAWQAAQKVAVPDGFVLVPKEPTNKMLDAGYESSYDAKGFEIPLIYKAMIEALQAKEEAIKMGATHYDDFGNYYMEIDRKSMVVCYQLIDNEWSTPFSPFLNLKPL